MWLIDAVTRRLKFVPGPGSAQYAILSHTWNGDDEVSFQEFRSPDRDINESRFDKIFQTCRLARERGIPYVWVDSCCIDKTSSAELTEAINSMFRWYKESTVCFTYLADLDDNSKLERDLRKCKWFTRGWTLQELLASKNMEFYNKSWKFIGSKVSLQDKLSKVTKIDKGALQDGNSLPSYPVALRMSWAALRHTTREEDLAYCLLGIFDVHLPLIYGEGTNAFIRLQEAIAQATCDLSLFAWTDQDAEETRQKYRGILARSPSEFKDCYNVMPTPSWLYPPKEYTITNKGLRINADLYKRKSLGADGEYLLFCHLSEMPIEFAYIRLIQTPDGYVRVDSNRLKTLFPSDNIHMLLERGVRQDIYISKLLTPIASERLAKWINRGFQVNIDNQTRHSCELVS
jgi:Heterokaryon incompatibility protein (HET)